MESHFVTERGASLIIGGIPDEASGTVRFAIESPYLLSLLAHGDPHAEVRGLLDFDRDLWPPVLLTHLSFQVLVGIGTLMMLVGLLALWMLARRPQLIFSRKMLWLLALMTPMGFIAVEAGWMVTELGRQPWIIYGIMRTEDALTPMPGLWLPFTLFFTMYLLLTVLLVFLMKRQIQSIPPTYPPGE